MKLHIYTDEAMTEVREIRERDRMKIPYRVGQYVIKAISTTDLNNDQDVLRKVLESEEQITAVVRATFGLSDEDLDHIDLMELADLAREIIGYVVGKIGELGAGVEGDGPNATAPATT